MFGLRKKIRKLKERELNNLEELSNLLEEKDRLLKQRKKALEKQLKLNKELNELLKQKELKINDLEIECEYLFNNLTPKKRETINADRKAK